MGDYILELVKYVLKIGEFIVCYMEYQYFYQGFIDCKDQFMLGDKYLVVLMLIFGISCIVMLLKGRWKDDWGKVFKGLWIMIIDVFFECLLYFEKLMK